MELLTSMGKTTDKKYPCVVQGEDSSQDLIKTPNLMDLNLDISVF